MVFIANKRNGTTQRNIRTRIAAPAGTPNAIVRGLNVEPGKIVQLPEVRSALAAQGLDAATSTPERLCDIVREAIATCAKIIQDVGIKID